MTNLMWVAPVQDVQAKTDDPLPIKTVDAMPLQVPVAAVSLNVPSPLMIGQSFSFTATFDNTDLADVGYGPFIDVYFPVTGIDGAGAAIDDGIDFVSASFLGGSITSVVQTFPAGPLGGACGAAQSRVNHPYAVDNTGNPVIVCGTPGDKVVTFQLPFGSFTPSQVPAVVTINATLSNLADAGTALNLRSRGGYQYGATPLNDWCCGDPSIVSAGTNSTVWPGSPVVPEILALTKVYNGPEGETASGPNYPRTFTVTVDIAPGQTIANLTIVDTLPNNLAYLNPPAPVTAPGGATLLDQPTIGAAASAPNNDLQVRWASVAGGAGANDASVTFSFFVPLINASSARVIDASSGLAVNSQNQSTVSGSWTPLDGRDPLAPVTAGGVCPTGCAGLTDRSLAIQKSVAIVTDVGVTGASPGDTVEFTLDFQISDFFAFQNLVVSDVINDGVRFDLGFTPTLQVDGNPYTSPTAVINAANFTVDNSQIGYSPAPGTDGSQTINFRVSDELVTRGFSNRLVGGCINPVTGNANPDCGTYNNGQTRGVIVFRATIQDQFTDTYPSGDASVDHGDILGDTVTVTGRNLNTDTFADTLNNVTDNSSASLNIAFGSLAKGIYAINGVVCGCGSQPYQIKPGDLVTYRIEYSQPSSDFEQTVLNDFLPLPVFSATDPEANGGPATTWTQDGTVAATPPAGQWKYGPTDTTHLRPSAPTPSLSTDGTNNTVSFTYAAYDDPTNTSSKIDLLFTVTTTSEPFTDRLFLTNQLTVNEGTTNSGSQTLNTIVQVVLTQPILTTKKGIVESSDDPANGGDAVYNPALAALPDFTEPGTAGLRFPTPILSSAAVGNSNISNVDAGDLVTFVIFVENSGSSVNGAFDIMIRDTLPAGYVLPTVAPFLNLDVRRGDLSSVSYTNIGTGFFDPVGGIQITDPGLGVGACEHGLVGNGRNVIVITYDLQVDISFSGGTIINTGTLFNYSGSEGGPDHTASDLSDTASTTIINAPVKSIVNTSETHTLETGVGTTADPRLAAIGEIVRYRIAVQIPEGTTNNFRIRDSIPAGMSFLNDSDTVSIAFVSNQGTCGQNISSSTLGSGPGQCGSIVLAPTFSLNFGSVSNNAAVSSLDSTVVGDYATENDDTSYGDGTDVYFKLGDITNADRDFDNEYIVVEFNVLMRNEVANGSGSDRDNTSIYRTGSSTTNSTVSNTTSARVVEPLITMGKSIVTLPSPLDAGGQVTYRITIANGTGANVSTAFDLIVTDTLPSAMTLDALPTSVVVATTGTVGVVDIITNSAVNSPPGTPSELDVRIASLAPNSSVQIDYTATINSSITPGEIVTNTGDLIWTSLPGAKGTTGNISTGSNTPGVSGDVDGERDGSDGPSGSPNDYAATDSENFTADSVAPVKSIVNTSASDTSETGNGSAGNPRDLAIGEIIRYRLAVQIVEGTTSDIQLVDTLPLGFTFLNDGSARISIIADTNVTEEVDLAGADNDALPPSFVLPASRIAVSGQDVTFTVGDLVNNDSDTGAENVVIDFNVLVNNDANNNNTDLDDNDFDLVVGGTTISTSNAVRTRIVEPVLTLTKTVSDEHPAPGQIVTFTLVVTNTGDATAFDVDITDGIPAELDLDLGSINVAPSGTVTGVSDSSTASQVHITASSMAVGSQLVITYDATVLAVLNDIFVNDADTTWTSLPGTNGTLVNSTGSSTPGVPGSGTGERTGSNVGPNDYLDSDQVTLTADRNLIKSLVASNVSSTTLPQVTIGEILTYQLILTIPAGSTDTAIIIDTLDDGLAFVDVSSFVVSDEDTDGQGAGDVGIYYSGSSTPVVTSSGHVVTFNLGDIANTDSTPETITITYRAIVLNTLANVQGGPVLDNDVDVTWSGGALSTRAVPSVEIVEPDLQIEKVVDPIAAALGSTVTFSITIDHTSESLTTAYDVVVFDSIPTGLILNEASVAVVTTNGGNGLPAGQLITTTPTTVTVRWDTFPLGAAATITFSAVFSGPAPVFNSANVEWSTLQIDPAPRLVPQSTFNTDSTERRYDPLAQAGPNNYVVSATARLSTPARLPRTGFAPGEVTVLPQKPSDFEYEAMSDLWLEIPRLGVKLDIVGVPLDQLDWNLTWLGSNAGYLSGTAYPTHAGNTGITAHAYLADGTPGPFVDLEKLQYGDQVIIHLGGQKYIYEIREESQVRPDAVASVLKHEKYSWLTLITCKTYNVQTKDYQYRSVARAVLIQVVDE